ncbi:MAG: hypothetical protein WKF81_04425 [Thermomicrobiales bacterium]
MTDLSLACALTGPDFRARRDLILESFFNQRDGTEELANGYAFRFDDARRWAAPALEFIEIEQKCCPFFTFQLEFSPESGPLRLKLLGPEGVKEFIRNELGLLESDARHVAH